MREGASVGQQPQLGRRPKKDKPTNVNVSNDTVNLTQEPVLSSEADTQPVFQDKSVSVENKQDQPAKIQTRPRRATRNPHPSYVF